MRARVQAKLGLALDMTVCETRAHTVEYNPVEMLRLINSVSLSRRCAVADCLNAQEGDVDSAHEP